MLLSRISRILSGPCQRRLFSSTADMEVDNLVIGAGVVGLALGEKLTRERPSEVTVVVDKHKRYGEETSSRNSEVIHAGIYYPNDSLKTRLCIQGNRKLYELLSRTRIPYDKVGKLVVAQSEEQHEYLKSLQEKASRLGVETHLISGETAIEMEPELRAHSALYSPSTGIIDSHALMDYLHGQIIDNGGDVALYSSVSSIRPAQEGGYHVQVETHPDTSDILARRVFNAAGLYADKVTNMVAPGRYKLHYARGCYYAYSGPLGVKHLIYPCPVKNLAGLGTHLTLDMAGKVKFGPDVQYIDSPSDYTVPDMPENRQLFAEAVKAILPSIEASKLHPDYAGIRPKLAGPGEPFRDFEIREEDDLKNFFTLIGIESPGLTSCLAIADYVHELIRD